MPNARGRTTEFEVSVAILRYLSTQPDGCASLEEIRMAIPYYIPLTRGDLEYSTTRPGEQLWEQLVRNIQSHHTSPNNFIRLGYLEHVPGGGYGITQEGREYLNENDLE